MFADSLLDFSPTALSRRGWSTLASFTLEALAIGVVLFLPLIYTSGLPQHTFLSPLLAPSAAPPLHAHSSHPAGRSASHGAAVIRLTQPPQYILRTIGSAEQIAIPAAPDLSQFSAATAEPFGGNGISHVLGSGLSPALAPPPPRPVAQAPRISRMMEGNLIYRVQPEYPALARLAHIQGAVLLRAMISRQGTIEDLQAVSGPPLLIKAAIEAVQQWRYRPYVLNGDPVEVDTQITVNFVLGGG
jgi:protein TonB